MYLRWPSAKMVSKAREDLPEPERPGMTTSRSRGISTVMFLRLCSLAPRTRMTRSGEEPRMDADGRGWEEGARPLRGLGSTTSAGAGSWVCGATGLAPAPLRGRDLDIR